MKKITLTLDKETFKFLKKVSKLSKQDIDTVVGILLAIVAVRDKQ